jgi:hypothetical protein
MCTRRGCRAALVIETPSSSSSSNDGFSTDDVNNEEKKQIQGIKKNVPSSFDDDIMMTSPTITTWLDMISKKTPRYGDNYNNDVRKKQSINSQCDAFCLKYHIYNNIILGS